MLNKKNVFMMTCSFAIILISCSKNTAAVLNPPVIPPVITPAGTNDMDFWLTLGNQFVLLQKQSATLSFGTTANADPYIDVDSTQTYQAIDGFGYTLTGGSAYVINQLGAADKAGLLKELFGSDNSSISISYLRISIGASDLNTSVFSYDDMPAPQIDMNLANFNFGPDSTDLIPLLQEILAINPAIKILAAPWSPPVWMKDNGNTKGGSLQTQYYDVYARYLLKYVQQMKLKGITIDAITPQNEPLNPNNNPSLQMLAAEQANFIRNNLGPAFQNAGISTKIITYDHNCDRSDYPLAVLGDAGANAFVNGSAFHLYAGDISTLTSVHNAYPDKKVYFTEQYTSSNGSFDGDLKWHEKNVVIGAMRNWSQTALEWNLASDATYNPHTPGGCSECKGALTIGTSVTRNVGYYIIAHASKFVPPGSVRLGTNTPGNLNNVAFKTPTGKKVLIVENDGAAASGFNIRYQNKWINVILPAGAVGTFTW